MGIATSTEATRHRWLVLAICTMSLFLVGLDVTIVNIALPAIRTDLDASVSQLQWVVDAYAIVVASLLILGGSTGDRLGRARIFKVGLTLFGLGSLLCSVAPTVELLIAFRGLQAIGGSMLNPVAMSIIRNTFEDPRERAQAIGVWAGVIGISMALGPVIGGALVEGIGWRAIFWVNVPVVLAAIVLTTRFIAESRAPRARRIDPVGQVLVFGLLASTTYAIIEAPAAGWTSPQTLGLFAFALVLLAALILYEPRREDPLIELRFFRSVPFSGATLIAIATFVGLSGFLFLITLYLQGARGMSPLEAGLHLLPMAATTLIVGPLTGRLIGRVGPRPSLVIGGAALLVSSLMLTGVDRHHLDRLARARVRDLRHRLRLGQPADHQHRRVRDAAVAGRGRGRHRLDQPAGRHRARHRDRRRARRPRHRRAGGARRGQPHGLVDPRRLRRARDRARDRDDDAVGAGDGRRPGRHRRAGLGHASAPRSAGTPSPAVITQPQPRGPHRVERDRRRRAGVDVLAAHRRPAAPVPRLHLDRRRRRERARRR